MNAISHLPGQRATWKGSSKSSSVAQADSVCVLSEGLPPELCGPIVSTSTGSGISGVMLSVSLWARARLSVQEALLAGHHKLPQDL